MNIDVSRETAERLAVYENLIRRWSPKINLVAPSTLPTLRARHIEDSLQIARLVQPTGGLWADLGSGGGLPGIVLAIAFAHLPTQFTLVESDGRKASFLRTVIRELGLSNASVKSARIEAIDPLNAAYLSARALAPLPTLMPYLARHLAQDGQAWLMKGEQWRSELEAVSSEWRFTSQAYPSMTQEGAAIIKISRVSHV